MMLHIPVLHCACMQTPWMNLLEPGSDVPLAALHMISLQLSQRYLRERFTVCVRNILQD